MKNIRDKRCSYSIVDNSKFVIMTLLVLLTPLCTMGLTSPIHAQVQLEQAQQSSSSPSSEQQEGQGSPSSSSPSSTSSSAG